VKAENETMPPSITGKVAGLPSESVPPISCDTNMKKNEC